MGLQKEYISWIDTAKGIGVFLVVIGHLLYDSTLQTVNTAIYSFHMPLFFIISGFLIYGARRDSFLEFLKKNFVRLIIPAYIYSLVFIPLFIYRKSPVEIGDFIGRLTFSSGFVIYNLPCWFFFVLFGVKLLERVFRIADRPRTIRVAICIFTFVLERFIYNVPKLHFYSIKRVGIAFVFLQVGILLRDIYENYYKKLDKKQIKIVIYIVLTATWFIFGVILNKKVSMYFNEFGRYWQFVISGAAGSVVFMKISQLVDGKIHFFRQTGKNSLLIIGTHYVLTDWFRMIMEALSLSKTHVYDIVSLLFAILLIIIYVPISKFVEKKAPILLGKTKTAVTH